MKDGGLGMIRRVSSLTLPAFLASVASTLHLQENIMSGCACSDSVLRTYLSEWLSSFGVIPDVLPPKQPFWDRPGILADQALVKSSLTTPSQSASFLAASSPHSGDWLFALPIASCGLRLDDEAVIIGVGLRLGSVTLCPASMPLRLFGRHIWSPQFRVQTCPGQIS